MCVRRYTDAVSTVEEGTDYAEGRTPAPAGPAGRLLATATELFASQGIRAIGVDQILREAAVAKASLYSTYGSKDALVLAYLSTLDQRDRNRWRQAVTDVADAQARVLVFFDLAIAAAPTRGFRGCLYANAATEYPDTELAPVREHRQWMHGLLAELITEADPAQSATAVDLAHRIQLIYDGALVGSKIERSTEPLRRARALTVELLSQHGDPTP
jgi:AcrR family transcriptional regulator